MVLVVDSTADAVDAAPGNGICATAAPVRCTLRGAVQESNALPGADSISIPAGTYELGIAGFNQNLAENGDLDLTDSVTIAGAQGAASSTIVDGGTPLPGSPVEVHGLDRLFEVHAEGGSVAFSDLTLREGWAAEHGGAIMNSSSAAITVIRSTLRANGAGKTGGAIDNHFAGTLDVVASTLSDNYAPEAGSAINNNRGGGMTLTNSVVSSNSAADAGLDESLRGAGAIANNAELDAVGAITVTASQITDNHAGAGRSGAGISNDGAGTVVIVDTDFRRNHAGGDGGALYNVNGVLSVTRCSFVENSGNNGGAVSSTGFGLLDVLESTFSKNVAADWGGALHNGNTGAVSIRSSTITENAALNGGGFGNEGSGLVTVESTSFTKNAAIDSATAVGGEGGGMHSNSGGEVVISGGAFADNRALAGGGFSNEGGGQVTMTGTRVASNHADEAGGGILIESGAVRMVGIDVVGNASDSPLEGGGGISYAGDKIVSTEESAAIEGSRIRDNTSKGDGGGIDSRGDGPLAITTTSITGNSALVGGAIHHVGDATLLVTRSTLSGNVAENGGGAFSDGDGEATVENSTISGNRAAQFGGGLLVSSRVTVRNATVSANQAAFGGGINNGGGDFVGDGSVFLANTIVSGNDAGGNCAGTVTSRGGNVENGDSCLLRELTDQPGTDPRLGPLADNGGPTRTHALLPTSPAQERAVCTDLDPCPSVDQRGIGRPVFVGVDAGAFESETTPGGGGPTQPCTGRSVRPVNADYDTWVSEGTPGANRGTDSILRVGSKPGVNERALVHFALPPIPPGCKLVAATLGLHSSSATEGRTLEVVRLSTAWGEHDVTWANQPAATGAAAATESGLDRREWNVLAQTLAMYANGAHGFVIRDAAESDAGQQSFHSREKGTNLPPELVLVFDDPDAPPGGGGGSCPTNPQVFFADRDSWVSEGSPANNFGNDSTLKVRSQSGSNSRALLHFPLPVLPAACTSVASATLRLDVSSAKDLRTIVVRQAGSPWTENGVTWANKPAAIGQAATLPSGEGILEWAVTPLVLDMYVTTNDGFVVADAEENGVGDEQTLSSRSKVNDGAPELVLVLDGTTPETSLGPLPPTRTPERDATLTFSSDRDDATFECSLDGAAFAPCSAPHALTGLAEGEHRFEVRAKRPVRAVDPTPASATWTVAIPPKTTLSGPASPSASAAASFTFGADDPEAAFECSLDEGPWTGCASPVEHTELADGSHELRVRGTDVLGNVEATPAAHVWTVAVPPQTAIDSGPPALTNLAFATFAFSAADNGPADELEFECSLDGAAFAGCSSPVLLEELADGSHTFSVQATDAAGNRDESAASRTWNVDTTAPETSIVTGPPTRTNDASASFAFASSEDGSSFACSLDDAAFTACESPARYEGLADGPHAFAVQATDEAGNADPSAPAFEWAIDTTPPETSITSSPPTLTRSTSAAFSFTSNEDGARFACSLDGAEFADCASEATYDGLADGGHTFAAVATDAAGNVGASAASHSWTVDTIAPETAITSSPPALTNAATASFSFTSSENGSTFGCSLDGAEFADCANGVSYENLADGPHTFAVRATDPAGNSDDSAASRNWKIDATAPETSIVTGPPTPTNDASASFAFASSEDGSSFACSLDDAAFTACESPARYEALEDGPHTFAVLATDEAGNTDPKPADRSWTVDTTPPETSIDSGPDLLTNAVDATFSFGSSEVGSSLECSLDDGVFASCETSVSYDELMEGGHVFSVRATDAAGNEDASAASFAWTVDTTAPETEIVSKPTALTRSADATFSFTSSEDGSTFACSLDGAAFASCWSPQDYADLADGGHTFAVRATDAAGNVNAGDASFAWTVDTTAPDTTLDSFPPTLTNVSTAGFSFGATEAGATFACSLDEADFASCETSVSYDELADGGHTFAVRATDLAGNEDTSSATYSWTVDTTAPETTIDSSPSSPTSSTGASFSFTSDEDGSTFECSLDGATFASCTSSKGYSGLADGGHAFSVRATDAAGNVDTSAATFAWTVDTAAPDTAIDTFPPLLTSSTGASFSFRSNEEGSSFACSLDGVAYEPCTSAAFYDGLADGEHTFAVHATDAAGNVDASPSTHTWTVDATPPETSITDGPAELTRSTDATFELSATEPGSTFACSLDGGAFSTCTSSVFYAGLGDSAHTFAVRATDAAGNTDPTPAEATWTVDTTPPDTSITASPPTRTNATTATFSFASTEEGSGFACALDGDAFSACESPATYAGLAEGAHTFAVRATDPAGNLGSAASFGWTVDTTAPETSIATGPQSLTSSTDATFTFTSGEEGSTFACSLDGGAFSTCTSAASYEGLADGEHTFAVRATDAAGNTDASAASRAWTIDSIAPDTTLTASPQPLTSATGASFSFVSTEDGSTFACALDGTAFAPCTSDVSYDSLADGHYVFSVRATDAAGNTDATPATAAWTVDTTAPQTAIDSGPPETTTSTSASFPLSASEPDATFACSLDHSDFATCSSPHEVTGLGLGAHELRVSATDLAGNVDASPASYAWTVQPIDTTPPQTTLTAGPAGPTNDPTPTFAFEADEPATFECRVDSAAFAACNSPHTTDVLAEGAHTFDVRAVDGAGLTDASPADASFTVDTTVPQTTLSSAPPATTPSQLATFEFVSSEAGSTFTCSLDGAAFTACTSPASYEVAAGSHSFLVQATDAAANTDATPASHVWVVEEVDAAAPETTIDSGPAGPTNDSTPTFAFSASETGSTFACSLDGAAFATCTAPVTTGTLADGAHTFEVRATDSSGNADPTAASRAFTVDTVAPQTTISDAPPVTTSSQLATFELASSETGSTFECSLDGAPFTACTSPASYTVGVGPHSFQAQATDAAGNADASPASHSWTVQDDATAPETTIGSGPSGSTPDWTPTFSFSSSETGSTFECSLDAAAFSSCTSPVTTAALADGAHTFQVQATDAAGNTDPSPATRSFTVDTFAPNTSITSGPSGPTNDSTPTYSFSSTDTGSTFQCSVDTAAFTACSSPFTTSTLSSGAHTFRVRATDPAGNLDQTPASRSITVDTSAPNTTINSGPPSSTPDRTAQFTFSSTDTTATFECSLGSAAFTACTTPASYTVPPGSYQFRVRAQDAAGNFDQTPATRNWTVTADTTAPQTTITSGTSGTTTNPVASFSFESNETGSTFECSLDGAAFSSCTSPASYTVATGAHTFQVRARDASGNVDASPASSSWTLQASDTTPPDTTIGAKPSSPTTDTQATFTFTATETGSTFECALDGTGFAACSSPVSYTVSVGSHTFQARARDAAGNLDQSPASHAWTVEAPPQGSCASGSTVTLGASADSWVLASSATSNYGADSALKVDSKSGANARALFRFALPAIPSGCQVVDAKLRLYAGSYKTGRTIQAFALTAGWIESGVTWSNQPAAVGTAASAASGSGYREWNVTAQLAGTYGANTGFLVRDQIEGNGGVEQAYNSREKGSDNPPRLVVTFG